MPQDFAVAVARRFYQLAIRVDRVADCYVRVANEDMSDAYRHCPTRQHEYTVTYFVDPATGSFGAGRIFISRFFTRLPVGNRGDHRLRLSPEKCSAPSSRRLAHGARSNSLYHSSRGGCHRRCLLFAGGSSTSGGPPCYPLRRQHGRQQLHRERVLV